MGVFTTHGGHQEQTEIDSESFSRSVDDIRSSYVRPRSIWVCTRRSSVKFRFSAGRQRRYSQRCFFLTWAFIRDVGADLCSVCEVYAERRTSTRKFPPTPPKWTFSLFGLLTMHRGAPHRSPHVLHYRETDPAQEAIPWLLQQVETDLTFPAAAPPPIWSATHGIGRLPWRRPPRLTKGRRSPQPGGGRRPFQALPCPLFTRNGENGGHGGAYWTSLVNLGHVLDYLKSYAHLFSGSYACSPEAMPSIDILGLP
jgi:hypothetical protein